MAKYFNLRVLLSELIGTFCLVFVGTCAIVINDFSHGALTHLGVSLVFGLVVMVLIHALGDISGAHFNPAVTLGYWVAKRFPTNHLLPYILTQISGAILASSLLKIVFPLHPTLGATIPTLPLIRSFCFELFLTTLLILVILNVTTGSKEKGLWAGIAIGGTVGLEALFAGPITGASMNPVRSIAPAIVSGHYFGIWIYIISPVLAAFIAPALHWFLQRPSKTF